MCHIIWANVCVFNQVYVFPFCFDKDTVHFLAEIHSIKFLHFLHEKPKSINLKEIGKREI